MSNPFQQDVGLLPPELQERVLSVARDFDKKLQSTENVGEAGGDMVRVSVKYPGNVTQVKFNCELKDENKALLEDLVVAATERAFKKLDLLYKDMTQQLAKEIKELVAEYIDEKQLGESLVPHAKKDEDDDDFFN